MNALQKYPGIRWLWIPLAIVALDQWTKHLVLQALSPYQRVAVIEGFFDWTLTFNEGVAFSLFHGGPGHQRWWLSGFALLVSGFFLTWAMRLPRREWPQAVALMLVVGGAWGNVIDRMRLGHVVDFILVYHRDWYWPAFNLADSAIVVGATLLIAISLWPALRRGIPPTPPEKEKP